MASVQILNNSYSNTQDTLKQVVRTNNNLRIVVGLLVVALLAVLISMTFLVVSSISNNGRISSDLGNTKSTSVISKNSNASR